ncbi:ArsR/SmtB family transcription factor [Amycolatopsis sp. H20-H5]|uniref:ArsR/SmtB family transcription factor n=1 Tax=Amycolatopsis sp. H20-H5 TaxID=3046309 RepID=UPI002DB6AD10|nr:metalloregulator ArsR/SmtB family transcription factor [Amycolatopsis sp. H20-H5]MEC3981840.1 metalloregulator ArsR/SmtB family transcription factor [Amycolatopsis sp. H20-H5]
MSTEAAPLYTYPARDEIHIEAVLHALADPIRLEMVRQLAESDAELACGEFELPVTKSTRTHHLRTLREAGLILGRQQGTTRYNSLRRNDLDALFPGLLQGVLAAPR